MLNQIAMTNLRQMPSAIEAEYAIIGALLIDSNAYKEIESIVKSDDFYVEKNKIIFNAVEILNSKHIVIDMVTVMQELMSLGKLDAIGGPYELSQATNIVTSSNHIKYHAEIVKEKSTARKLIELSSKIVDKSFEQSEPINETIEYLEKAITEVNTGSSENESISLAQALKLSTDKASEIQSMREKGIDISIKTGLSELNREFNGGFRSPDLIIIGGRPSMGKTQLGLHFAKHAALSNKHVLFVSIEMTASQLADRLLLEDDRISMYNLRTGHLSMDEWKAIDTQAGNLYNLNINIADSHNIRYINNIKSEARRMKRQTKLDILFIDYLGLIRTNMKFGTRDLEIGYITGELKNLAKELSVPVVLLSQLSRPPKGMTVKEPQLEDLRESGNIEQDADIVLFIHRPSYYDPAVTTSTGESWENKGKLIIAKYREGARNRDIIFRHDDNFKKIFDNDQQHPALESRFKKVEYVDQSMPF